MCGRFQLSVKGSEISERFNVDIFDELYKPSYNCAPGQQLPVITGDLPGQLQFFHWGLVPFWAKDKRIASKLINSRAETISQKPAFKKAFTSRRCLIPANGFYEWKRAKTKTPYRFFLANEKLFAMAGIWESWKSQQGESLHSFSIITTAANNLLKPIHHRMPVILQPQHERLWLETEHLPQLEELLQPFPVDQMDAYPVSILVNKVQNNGPELIEPRLPQSGSPDLFNQD